MARAGVNDGGTGYAASLSLGRRLSSRLLPAAVTIAVLISAGFPAIYYVIRRAALEHEAAFLAEEIAREIRTVAAERPGRWSDRPERYADILRKVRWEQEVKSVLIVDSEGTPITWYATDDGDAGWTGAAFVQTAPISRDTVPMGVVRVEVSPREVLRQVMVLGVISTAAGTALAAFVFFYPVRVTTTMAGEIEQLVASVERSNTDLSGLLAESRRQERAATVLEEVARAITSSLDRRLVLERIVEHARSLCSADVAALATYDPDTETAVVVAVSGARHDPAGWAPIRRGLGNAGRVLETGRAFWTARWADEPDVSRPEGDVAAAEGVVAAGIVPLIAREQSIGLLSVGRRGDAAFDQHARVLLERLAAHAVIAFENAQLYEERTLYVQEEERRRIAYELHDGVAQLIVSARQHVDTCRDVWKSDPARAEEQMGKALDRLERAIKETRLIMRALKPAAVDSLGLVEAVRQSLAEGARECGWSLALRENLGTARLSPAIETAAFRIVQEALTNVSRHAEASQVDVELWQDQQILRVEVRDTGVGFDAAEAESQRRLGFSSMRERAQFLGGSCRIESAPGQGTRVSVRLPLTSGAP
jgi:signal transduction histidine kinase